MNEPGSPESIAVYIKAYWHTGPRRKGWEREMLKDLEGLHKMAEKAARSGLADHVCQILLHNLESHVCGRHPDEDDKENQNKLYFFDNVLGKALMNWWLEYTKHQCGQITAELETTFPAKSKLTSYMEDQKKIANWDRLEELFKTKESVSIFGGQHKSKVSVLVKEKWRSSFTDDYKGKTLVEVLKVVPE